MNVGIPRSWVGPGAGRQRAGLVGESPRPARAVLVRMLGYYRPFWKTLSISLACVVAYTGLGLAGPYLVGVAIDGFISQGDAAGLGRIALLMLATFVLSSVFRAAASCLTARMSQQALSGLRRHLLAHLEALPIELFDRRPPGELMGRLTSDIEAINPAGSLNVAELFGSFLSMAGILVTMFALDGWLALASVFVVPLMFWFTRLCAAYTRRGFKDLQQAMGELNGVMEEGISGHAVVKIFGDGDALLAAFNERNEVVHRTGTYANTYALLLTPVTAALGNLFVVAIVGLGGVLALSGLATVGVITTFVVYGQNFIHPLRQIANLYNSLQAALAAAERVFEVLDTPKEPDVVTAPAGPSCTPRHLSSLPGRVTFENVRFAYAPGTPVLQGMTFDALPGQTLALVGPTGAGKTTIVNVLTRFYEIEAGAIRIDGIDIRELPKAELRAKLGLVLQSTHLRSGTVLDNIRYGRVGASDEDVRQAALLADADHFIRQLPDGYDTVLSERGANLSQGQRQLLAIARTLLADPAILILDEAMSSVDPRTELRIQQSLRALMKGRTSFVIAHRLRTIVDADQVLVIDGGRIVQRGRHGELLRRQGLYRQLYLSQFKGRTDGARAQAM